MSEEIKPCPFCGSEVIEVSWIDDLCHVYCVECQSKTNDFDTYDDALMFWNQRPYDYDMPAIVKKVKELETKNKELQKELDYLREWTSLLEGME